MTATADAERSSLILDTHVLVWLVEGHTSLGSKAQMAIQSAADHDCLLISAITPWEIALLVSKNRLKLNQDVLDWLHDALANPGMKLSPLEPEIAVQSTRFPFEMHADPADRILVATARQLGASLITADHALLDLAGSGHFRAVDATR